jgi:hypothetical protein
MQRSIVKNVSLRHWLLFGCLILTLATALSLNGRATAWNQLRQDSPLSPLNVEPGAGAAVESSSTAPSGPGAEREIAPLPAEAPAALTLPLGEPLQAQTSLFLVGLVLIGLVVVVVLIVIRQRRT